MVKIIENPKSPKLRSVLDMLGISYIRVYIIYICILYIHV